MLLVIHIDDAPYIADVGFGGSTLPMPIQLTLNITQPTSHEHFRLIPVKEGYIL